MTGAIVYARFSTDLQSESSIDAQLRECREFCAARGYSIVAEHIDRAESGSTMRRPGFTAMMADVRAHRCQIVVTHKLDRLSRSMTDIVLTMHEFHQHGVQYVSVLEQFDFTTPVGRIILAVLAALAEWYLSNLKTEVHKGKRQRAVSGKSNASTPPFGYSRVPGEVERPNDGASHVLWAATAYAGGATSYSDIAAEFNRRGLVTTRGGRWGIDSVREMIQNPFYAGWVTERGVSDELTASGTRRRVARSKRKLYPGQHEPIIPQALFDQCRAVRAARYHNEGGRKPKRVERYLLGGIATCAHCGQRMRAGARPDGKHANYLCTSAQRGEPCDSHRRMIAESLLAPQVDAQMARLRVPEVIQQRALEVENRRGAKSDYERTRKRLDGELRRVNLIFQKGNMTEPAYDAECARLRGEMARLARPVDVPAAVERLSQLADLWDAATSAERALIVRTIYSRVEIDADTQRITHWEPRDDFARLGL